MAIIAGGHQDRLGWQRTHTGGARRPREPPQPPPRRRAARAAASNRMGRVVTFAHLLTNEIIPGINSASITKGETQKMAAEYIWIPSGQRWIATATRETDCYLFMLDGTCAISAADSRHRFPTQAFAVVQEGVEFTVQNDSSAPASIIKVIAPPQPNNRGMPGFIGNLAVTQRAEAPHTWSGCILRP